MAKKAERKKLTTRWALSAPAPTDKDQVLYFDREVPQFALRVLKSGTRSWIINITKDAKLYRRDLGSPDVCSAEEARDEARVAIGQILSGQGEYVIGREEKRAEREAAKRAAREAAAARADAKVQTLRKLCELYVADLERRGKSSANDVAGIFRRNVYERPEAEQPARELKPIDIANIIRRVVDAGKGREAAKLRSYLRAAYQRAAEASTDAAASDDLTALRVEINPVAATKSLSQFNKADDRDPLTEQELSKILRSLSKDQRRPARVTWLNVLLGGQRPTQLLRAKVANYDGMTITLFDPKGRRKKVREHLVPVIGEARSILDDFAQSAKARGSKLLFSTHGKIAISNRTLNDVVVEISKAMAKTSDSFSQKHLRAAVETQLAALGVTKEVRAQLLSHGVSGVQDTHYNKYDFLKEKTEALRLWHARIKKLIAGKPALRVVEEVAA